MAQQQEVPIIENLIEIRTLSDEEVVSDWAIGNKISADAVEKLFKEGFTSVEAIKLLDSDDLSRSKIPRGQQKLILASVKKLFTDENRTGLPAHVQQAGGDHVGVESFPSGSGSMGAKPTNQRARTETGTTMAATMEHYHQQLTRSVFC